MFPPKFDLSEVPSKSIKKVSNSFCESNSREVSFSESSPTLFTASKGSIEATSVLPLEIQPGTEATPKLSSESVTFVSIVLAPAEFKITREKIDLIFITAV